MRKYITFNFNAGSLITLDVYSIACVWLVNHTTSSTIKIIFHNFDKEFPITFDSKEDGEKFYKLIIQNIS